MSDGFGQRRENAFQELGASGDVQGQRRTTVNSMMVRRTIRLGPALLLVLAGLFLPGEASAQGGTWATKTSMATPRYDSAVGVVNGILYVVGGCITGTNFNSVEAYDPVTNTWTSKTPMPTARCGLAIGVVQGILYAVGGAGDNLTTVEAYDPATDTWTSKAAMPIGLGSCSVGVVGGILYVVGGQQQRVSLDGGGLRS